MKKTNFPKRGDNLKVSLRNSQYERPPLKYVLTLKEEYPEIWGLGGNIKGNEQFRDLSRVVENDGVADKDYLIKAVKLREAWAARHTYDFRIRGVVAQLKWFVIGSRGFEHMKETVDNEITRRYGDE
jgi:hypothetical protein